MYSQLLTFIRFGCYVHNPDAIFTKARTPIMRWLNDLQLENPELCYTMMSKANTTESVISIEVPSTLHHALHEFDSDYIFTSPNLHMIKSILTAKRNTIHLNKHNIRKFTSITKTTPAELVEVVESYLTRIEINPMQPVTLDEIQALKDLGVEWRLVARLPRVEDGDFEPVYIVDEHHRVRCL